MYNTLHLHMRALHTAAPIPVSRTQPVQILDAFSKLLTFWTLHNTVWILICPLGWEVNGQEWVITAWIIHSTHKRPQLSPSNNSRLDMEETHTNWIMLVVTTHVQPQWFQRRNIQSGNRGAAGKTAAVNRVIPPRPGSALKKPLDKITWGFQQLSSPSLVCIGEE